MKAIVYSIKAKKKAQAQLPPQFSEPVRLDLIRRAVLAQRSRSYQRHGTDPLAGTRQGAATSKRRHTYGTSYGYGISRVKRKRLWTRGSRFGWVAAFVASATGGRKAFPPKAEKTITENINKRERKKAIRSAIAATLVKAFVQARGHQIKDLTLPLVVEDGFESLKKTAHIEEALQALGLKPELARAAIKKVRAGRGTTRGRRYRKRTGPLIIVSKSCDALRAGRGIAGLDVVDVHNLNAELLAPGTVPGRLTVWTAGALKALDKERLFM